MIHLILQFHVIYIILTIVAFVDFIVANVIHGHLQLSLKQLGAIHETGSCLPKAVRATGSDCFTSYVSHFHSATILAMSHTFLHSRSEEQLIPGFRRNFFLIIATVIIKNRRDRRLRGFLDRFSSSIRKRQFNSKLFAAFHWQSRGPDSWS